VPSGSPSTTLRTDVRHGRLATMVYRNPSMALLKILRGLADAPRNGTYGLELMRRSGVAAGTLYPALDRLEREGWVAPSWEEIDESLAGRRRRCYYALTSDGRREAEALLDDAVRALARPGVLPA